MKPEAMRVAIAEACGWKRDDVCDCWRLGKGKRAAVAFMNGSHCHRQLPDYLSDLNACHEMEKVLTSEQRGLYIATLLPLTGTVKQDLWYTAHATAPQRCEAFLKSTNRWQPGSLMEGGK